MEQFKLAARECSKKTDLIGMCLKWFYLMWVWNGWLDWTWICFVTCVLQQNVAGLVKAKKYDWKDSNLALFGSDTDKEVKSE